MSKQFRVSFTADETKLPILVSLLAGEVDGFHVQDLEKARANGIYKSKSKKRGFDPSRIRSVIEWPSAKKIMEFLKKEGAMSSNTICAMLSQSGYAASSGSGLLHKLKKEGHLRVVGGMENGRPVSMFIVTNKERGE